MQHEEDSLRAPTVDAAGKRRWIYPDRRSGRLSHIRGRLASLLLLVYVCLPFTSIHGLPVLRFDVLQSRVYVWGLSFNFTDANYLVFVFLAGALALGFVTSLWGRIWCGYACPQTVFVEWVIRPIEEWIEGPALRRKRADQGPKDLVFWLRKGIKHLLFILIIWVISHAFLAYFIDPHLLFGWIVQAPDQHEFAFAVMLGTFAALYFDLIWFREQFCSFLCPYARFQSVMISRATPTVAYDQKRGEPRGHHQKGDCIDCGLCVRVCPTGIDIRKGLQLECIQCSRCVDACHDIMTHLKRPAGLIRTASALDLAGGSRKVLRWRPALYLTLFLVNLGILSVSVAARESMKSTILRQAGTTFSMMGSQAFGNYFSLRVVNRGLVAQEFRLEADPGIRMICSVCRNIIEPGGDITGNLVLIIPIAFPKDSILLSTGTETIDLPLIRPRSP